MPIDDDQRFQIWFMPIHLFDSLERASKPLAPAQPDGVFRFYNCGPTVYAPAHIGNFRTFINFQYESACSHGLRQ